MLSFFLSIYCTPQISGPCHLQPLLAETAFHSAALVRRELDCRHMKSFGSEGKQNKFPQSLKYIWGQHGGAVSTARRP